MVEWNLLEIQIMQLKSGAFSPERKCAHDYEFIGACECFARTFSHRGVLPISYDSP